MGTEKDAKNPRRKFGMGVPRILGYLERGCQLLGVPIIPWHRTPRIPSLDPPLIINSNIGPLFDVTFVKLFLSKINALQTRDDILHPRYKAEPEKTRTIRRAKYRDKPEKVLNDNDIRLYSMDKS